MLIKNAGEPTRPDALAAGSLPEHRTTQEMQYLHTPQHVRRGAIAAALALGVFLGLGYVGAGFAQTAKPAAPGPGLDGPLTPEQAPRSFRLEPGLRLELVAAEPLVVSPVAVAFDERGRMYVAEDRGYPTGPGPGQPPVGRIARLDDTDGDGRMDRRTEFADGLSFPNGLMPWKGGLIVTCAPDVFYLRDTDGDGKADEKRVLFTGFATNRSTQLRVSHPTLSRDNWVYLTNGLSGGKVTSPEHPDRPAVVLNRADFRFRPDGDAYEAADGGAQFGQTIDDFNRRFICYNRVQVQHVVIDSKTLRRNPHLAFSATVQNCPAETVAEPLKGHGAAARLFPISRNITTADSHAGTFTAACSVLVYRGNGLHERYRGGAFSCDPTGNLVHFDRLEPRGATFAALPGQHGMEFLASSDNWFRPVFVAAGPEGALYVCDMYRKTIEHPDYLSPEIRKRTDFESGKTMGRLWRVVRDDLTPDAAQRLRRVDLADSSTQALCETLRNLDGWHRDTAQRLLLERHDPAAAEPLRALAADPQAPAASVVQALDLLERFAALPDELLRTALKHRAAPVRENALELVRSRIAHAPGWLEPVLALADDPDARVRFEAAIALGDVPAEGGKSGAAGQGGEPSRAVASVAAALARIAVRDGADRWTRAAVFSSLAGRELAFLTALRDTDRFNDGLPPELLNELGRLLGASRPRAEWSELVARIVAEGRSFSPEEQAGLLTGLAEAARARLGAAGARDVLAATIEGNASLEPAVRSLVERMKRTAADADQPLPRRETAVGLLALAGFEQTGETLLRLVDSDPAPELRTAAVRALGSQRDDRVAAALLKAERFANYPPRLHDEVLSAVVSQSQHVPGLLSALEQGSVPVAAIDALRRRQLSQSRDPAIRSRAQKLFGAVSGDRAKVYEAYKDVVDLKTTDPAGNGRAVFRRECASCHRLDREGFAVGPDLFGMRNQPKATILLHILVPDHEITAGFAAYTVATKDGRVLTGLITAETPTSITLRQPLGKEDSILRSEIEELSASKLSLMPQGLEKNISRQDFADLLAYLKGEGYSSEGSAP
jgi:putative membrane-bound dehydrogenase-like protein